MAANRSDQIVTVVERLVADEDLHEHLSTAATKLRAAQGRIQRRGVKAADDKKVYAQVRGAAHSLLAATRLVKEKPKPKRRGRKVAVVAAVAGGAAFAAWKLGSSGPHPSAV